VLAVARVLVFGLTLVLLASATTEAMAATAATSATPFDSASVAIVDTVPDAPVALRPDDARTVVHSLVAGAIGAPSKPPAAGQVLLAVKLRVDFGPSYGRLDVEYFPAVRGGEGWLAVPPQTAALPGFPTRWHGGAVSWSEASSDVRTAIARYAGGYVPDGRPSAPASRVPALALLVAVLLVALVTAPFVLAYLPATFPAAIVRPVRQRALAIVPRHRGHHFAPTPGSVALLRGRGATLERTPS